MLHGQEQLSFGCGIVTSTVDAPTGVCVTAVSKSIMLCGSSSAEDSSPVVLAWLLFCKQVGQRLRPAGKKRYP